MPKVISANYLDRDSEYKWLVRDANADPSTVIACKRVVAKNVRFQRSGTYEEGFGCSVVAVALEAEMFDVEDKTEELRFDGYNFRIKGQSVTNLAHLNLNADGSMRAIPL